MRREEEIFDDEDDDESLPLDDGPVFEGARLATLNRSILRKPVRWDS